MSLFHTADPANAHLDLHFARANAQRVRDDLYDYAVEKTAGHRLESYTDGFLAGIAYAAFLMDFKQGTQNVGPWDRSGPSLGGDVATLAKDYAARYHADIMTAFTPIQQAAAFIEAIPAAPKLQEVA